MTRTRTRRTARRAIRQDWPVRECDVCGDPVRDAVVLAHHHHVVLDPDPDANGTFEVIAWVTRRARPYPVVERHPSPPLFTHPLWSEHRTTHPHEQEHHVHPRDRTP
jgi:hypothetical protein